MSSKTKTTATKEEAKPVLVPNLRFPGFSAPWVFEPLSKVLKEYKLKNTDGRDVFSVSMEYGIVNQIELLGRSYAAADPSHYTIGRRYDVVYTKSPLKAFPFGIVKQCKFDGEVALSPLYGVFTPPNPHLGLMIEAYFESPNRSKDYLSPLCQKGAKNTLQITNTTFLSGRLPLPTQPAEQQKIAECLSSVDELIAAQARKVDALKTHKKGLMQQLFPREGETHPRLRFPEFQNAGEWEPQRLSELIDLISGMHLSPDDYSTVGEVPYFTGPSDFTNDLSNVTKWTKRTANVSQADDTLITVKGSGVGEIWYSTLLEVAMGRQLMAVRSKNGSSRFMFQFLLTKRSRFEDLGSGNLIPGLSRAVILELEACFPKPPEQQRIATCLSSLDALITAETQKHEALKTHKKGLMQQLFPSPEERTT